MTLGELHEKLEDLKVLREALVVWKHEVECWEHYFVVSDQNIECKKRAEAYVEELKDKIAKLEAERILI